MGLLYLCNEAAHYIKGFLPLSIESLQQGSKCHFIDTGKLTRIVLLTKTGCIIFQATGGVQTLLFSL